MAMKRGVQADFTVVVARVDGRIHEWLRIWLEVEKASRRLDGRMVTVVMHRRNLSAACQSQVNLLIGFVAADYPRRVCIPLFSLARLQRDHCRLWVGEGDLIASAISGQYFRISPVSRP